MCEKSLVCLGAVMNIFGGLLLLLSAGVNSQMETIPIRLTGQKSSWANIQLGLFDQCLPSEESKTFGIEFRLPKNGGSCDKEGIIICYASTLSSRTLNVMHTADEFSVNSELFNVPEMADIDKKCQEMMTAEKVKNAEYWRGFRVYTELMPENNQRVIKLTKKSVEGKTGPSYEIRDVHRQFVINFGNAQELYTYVTIDFGEQIEIDEADKKKREAYTKYAQDGVPLKDFAGFWTLGMDIVPWDEDILQLFIIRDCKCTMEAWFIRPSDSEPEDPEIPTQGSYGCHDEKKKQKAIDLRDKIKAEKMIYIRLLTSARTEHIGLTLLGNDADKFGPLMKFVMFARKTIRHESEVTKIVLREKTSALSISLSCSDFINKTISANHEIVFKIAFTKYAVGIAINDHLPTLSSCNREYVPLKWWKGLPLEKMTTLKLEGKFLLLNDPPPVMDFVTLDTNYKSPYIDLPFNNTLRKLQYGKNIIFRIQLNNAKSFGFIISLLHDRPEKNEDIGATIMEMNVMPTHISMTSFSVEKKSSEPIKDSIDLSKEGAMEINITLFKDDKIIIQINDILKRNYTSEMPTWATNFVRVEEIDKYKGGITLMEKPFICIDTQLAEANEGQQQQQQKDGLPLTKRLMTVLNYGDVIRMEFLIKRQIDKLTIALMHEAKYFDKRLGDTILALTFDFSYTEIHCQYYLNLEHKNFDHYITNGPTVEHLLNKYGQKFNLSINCTAEHFIIKIDEVDFEMNCPYPFPEEFRSRNSVKEHRYPPWAVDHIHIECEGNASLVGMEIRHANVSIGQEHVLNFVEINADNGVLRAGDKINVRIPIDGTIGKTEVVNVSVNLFFEALRTHPHIGKTIMRVELKDLDSAQLNFRSYKKQPENCKIELKDKDSLKEFNFEIKVEAKGFVVALNGMEPYKIVGQNKMPCKFTPIIPIWAVQYITVEYNENAKIGKPVIKCEPQSRCLAKSEVDNYLCSHNL
ncbi:hypothetical protein niasHT_006611 [Heterodera trifolii]|uniref:Uncharacterized protein n=1 Tax=Heterodera trifolii TaxID=157864 RepID=A0ABD2M7M0_9BILA